MFKNLKSVYRESIISESLSLLTKSDRNKIIAVICIQIILAILDLIAVGLIGLIATIGVSGVRSTVPSDRVLGALDFAGISELTLQEQTAILGFAAAFLLIIRTVFSIIVTRKVLYFLSIRGATIASDLFARIISQPLLSVQKWTTQEILYAVTNGISAITLGVIGALVSTIADSVIMAVMLIGLFVINPVMATGMLLFFGLAAFFLYKLMSQKSHQLGVQQAEKAVEINSSVVEVLNSYRELLVRNRRNYYSRRVRETRLEAANVLAQLQFLPNISKYVIETMIVIGALLVAAAEFLMQDAGKAIATISVFLAAGTRIAPAILRIQQGAISIRGASGGALQTLNLMKQVEKVDVLPETTDELHVLHPGFVPEICVTNLSYIYPGNVKPALKLVNFKISRGETVAIVGPSGAGKTTLVDLILGVIEPETGSIQISNEAPLDAISRWPGAIAYVPQDIMISDATISENVGFGFPKEGIDFRQVQKSIEFAELTNFVESLEFNERHSVGERGSRISGGQRQRLGIARAMYTDPKLLILDEATSTLDAQTEKAISESLQKLGSHVTVLMIAHRLSTVKNADKVIYIEDGEVKAIGTLEHVRQNVPNFDSQAKLMGL